MKKQMVFAILMGGTMVMSAMAADWSGYIIDKSCASKKGMWGNVQCAQSCIKRGDQAVLVTEEGKVFSIADQDKVKDSAGKKVTITGTMKGDSISVDSVKEM
ncbi:MAG TPA: DUF5818 domain-containing protein [Bryobacteraceae bacterium]|nr:DUF5818 domain-containing protein [Bryobacteraceae bacterium]